MKFVCWNLKDKKFFILKRRGIWTWKRITSNLRKAAKHISLRDPLFTTLASSIRNYSQTHSGHISKEKKGMRHIQSRRDKSNYYDHPLKRRGVATSKRARAKRVNVKDTLFVLSQMWNIHNQKKNVTFLSTENSTKLSQPPWIPETENNFVYSKSLNIFSIQDAWNATAYFKESQKEQA